MAASELESLIQLFAKLPGLGPRSARRAVLYLIRQKEKLMLPLSDALRRTAETTRTCSACGNLDTVDPCHICTDDRRDRTMLCIIEDLADLWAIERSHMYKGLYHVLGGTLSALDGRGPTQLNMDSLPQRVRQSGISEVILATNATVDGQTTAHYITDMLEDCNVRISRLAQGIPMGGELDYLDDGTLGAALKARLPF